MFSRSCFSCCLALWIVQTAILLNAEQDEQIVIRSTDEIYSNSTISTVDQIPWFDNYSEALEEAKRTQKPIFIEFRCEP